MERKGFFLTICRKQQMNLSSESNCDLSSEERESGSDTASKTSGSSTTIQTPTKNGKHGSHQGDEMAQVETQMLAFIKASVFAVFLLVAVGCAAATYLITHRGEEQDFEDEVSSPLIRPSIHYTLRMKARALYLLLLSVCSTSLTCHQLVSFSFSFHQVADYATEIFEVSQIIARSMVDTISAMSVTITSYAFETKVNWPFVTIPDFERRGSQVMKLSGAKYLAFCPLVNETNLPTWEQWSVANQDWIPEVKEARSMGDNSSLITPFIFHFAEDGITVQPKDITDRPLIQEEEKVEGNNDVAVFDEPHLAPFWQVAPALPSLVNFNSFSYNELFIILDEVFKTRAARLSELLIEDADPSDEDTWPCSYLVAPVYESFDEEQSERPVALLQAVVPWHNFFRNVLPEGTPGVFLVLTNTCGQEVTCK